MTHLLRHDDGMTIYVGCPDVIGGKDGRLLLAEFYQQLLGWHRYEAYDDLFLTTVPWSPEISERPKFRIGFNETGWSDLRPPRWPDPEYPQQAHLDILVPDGEAYGRLVTDRGAKLLQDGDEYRIYADPAGHPFCLYPDPSRAADGPVVARLVFDCFSPRALATFYEGFLGVPARLEDSPERVVIDLHDEELPDLAFQHAPLREYRHPNPDYPAQLHVDYRFPGGYDAAKERAERLGAIHIPLIDVTYADPEGHPFCL